MAKTNIKLDAFYKLIRMPPEQTADSYVIRHCYGGGQYCVVADPEMKHDNGLALLHEIIRQKLILRNHGARNYLAYMKMFD